MFHHFLFIKRLARKLNEILGDAELFTCFSQNRDELILGFILKDNSDFFIKASLESQLCLLSFPDDYKRARKNSIELFNEAVRMRVSEINSFSFERSFSIKLENNFELLFKMHGYRSNVILIKDRKAKDVFKSALDKDMDIDIDALHKNFHLDELKEEDIYDLEQILGKKLMHELGHSYNYHELDIVAKGLSIRKLVADTDKNPICIVRKEKPELSLLSESNCLMKTEDPVEACNFLYRLYSKDYFLNKEKDQMLLQLKRKQKKLESYTRKAKVKIKSIKNRRSYEEIGHLIMANMHNIKTGVSSVQLTDFYDNSTIEIKLKSTLSPQKNAESYYRKAKNEKLEIRNAEKNLRKKEIEINDLTFRIKQIESAGDLKELRKLLKNRDSSTGDLKTLPYRKFSYLNFDIWVGKNSKSNDTLTFKHTHKNDLWLHARNISGSHVVVKNASGNTIPTPVIEYAASVAAYYSKGKTEGLCPVLFTQKKYVRKPKGMSPGEVIVDKEEVILVKPTKPT